MRKQCVLLATTALMLASTSAFAVEEFASKGTAAFSADRMFGFTSSHVSYDNGAARDTSVDVTSFSFGWKPGVTASPADVPRLSFDYFVINQLSIGGSIGFADYSDDADGSLFLFAPRVGYDWRISRAVSFWLRGGFSYASSTVGNDRNAFAFFAEPTFAFEVAPHFGFTVGLSADFSLSGKVDYGSVDDDWSYRTIGLQLGMFGWL